jgi:hypothetical protein
MTLTVSDFPSTEEALELVRARLADVERPHVEDDLRVLARQSSLDDYVERVFELAEDDIASLLFETKRRLEHAGAAVQRRRLRVLWFLWCARFDDDDQLLAYLKDRIPPDACRIEHPTDFLIPDLAALLSPPHDVH